MELVLAYAGQQLVDCPDCDGTGSYHNFRSGEFWDCQFCDGEGKVPNEIAQEQKQQLAEYQAFYNEHISPMTGKVI